MLVKYHYRDQIMDDEMGCECGTYGEKKNSYKDWVKNHEGKIQL